MTDLTGPQFEQLREIMMRAFSREDLQLLLGDLGLDPRRLAWSAPPGTFVYEVIREVAAQGRTGDLLHAIAARRPGDEKLQALIKEVLPAREGDETPPGTEIAPTHAAPRPSVRPPQVQSGPAQTYKIGASSLTIAFGDLTTSTAQVLVSSDDYYLSMSGGVSASILKAGGRSIQLDAAKKAPAALGDVIVTAAGSLPAQYIFHAITIGPYGSQMAPEEVIRSTTSRCLQMLDVLRLNSIAFPAIGAGVAGFSYTDVAVQMAEVICEELEKRPTPVDVTLYLLDRLGRMKELDWLVFFVEFARRTPRLKPIPNPQKIKSAGDESEPPPQPTDEKWVRMKRRNNLLLLIAKAEDQRLDLAQRLVALIATDREQEKAQLRQQKQEVEDLVLGWLNELEGLAPTNPAQQQKTRTALCDMLANRFSRDADYRRMAGNAGLNLEKIAFDAAAVNSWDQILLHAEAERRVNALIDEALKERPADTGLRAAATKYLSAHSVWEG